MNYPEYPRPYFDEYAHCNDRTHKTIYVYNDELFSIYDIFDIFILDGGAFFFSREFLQNVSGTGFLNAFEGKDIFMRLLNGNGDEWKHFNKELLSSEPPALEKYCWFNRLYMLLPIAHRYYLTGDKSWAEQWFRYFESWLKGNCDSDTAKSTTRPVLWHHVLRKRVKSIMRPGLIDIVRRHLAIRQNIGDICWRDMQLSWRLLVLIHSVYLLGDCADLGRTRWKIIYRAIFDDADRIYREAKLEFKMSVGIGNHFLHKGVALLYLGTLYPEVDNAEAYLKLGRDIVDYHSENETTSEGANIENSPSYSHFIARLHLESELLLKLNCLPVSQGLAERVARQYDFLNQISSPSDLSLPVNDSYHLDVSKERSIVSYLEPDIEFKSKESHFYSESSFAVLRHLYYTLYVDGTSDELGHHHLGKPNILLYFKEFPVIIDPGCCNYDMREDRRKFTSHEAHNIVKIDPLDSQHSVEGKGMGIVRLHDFICRSDIKSIYMSREMKGKIQYLWCRRIVVKNQIINILDNVKVKTSARITILFHFAPSSIVDIIRDGIVSVTNPNWRLKLSQSMSTSYVHRVNERSISDEHNKRRKSFELATVTKGTGVQVETTITFA